MAMGTIRLSLDCSRFDGQDLRTIDEIARIRLEAARRGWDLGLVNAGRDLSALIDLAGLGGVLRVQPERKIKKRKEPGRVEEEGELSDPSI